ncbi:aminopeptidase [Deinococcus sp. KNUC1210]|uniref:aminopeptidase n=1 Tax=Deinococcus sp. KNUC1210 TaxID=2917691 RepID=UPI001EF038AE|nr:aminopeptidase [Deinococcus sp. KNUC1210]ULH14957.1 aminopeptidase [Deinococcus sp. KNUC1210]
MTAQAAALSFEDKLANYADLLVRVGVDLQPGGKLRVDAPIEAASLVRLIAAKAYDAGALDVAVNYRDQHLGRVLYERAPDAALDYAPEWVIAEAAHQMDEGYAFLSIAGSDPDLLAGIDQGKIARRSKTMAIRSKPLAERQMAFEINWTVGAMPIPSWATKVFPDVPQEQAIAQLWDAIFAVSRADQSDPVAAWRTHLERLSSVTKYLNKRRYSALHFRNPGSDITFGLAEGHLWAGGAWPAQNGILGVPNLPTDEVFTAPHRDRVDGYVSASKPLSVRGTLIEGIRMRFEAGRVVEATSTRGQDVLEALLNTDEGARHLGELALVEYDSPVARAGMLFYNTLFDENAASHIALGQAYAFNVEGGTQPGRMAQAGANESLIHVDWMIGTPDTDVDGIRADGQRESVMRAGKWAYEAPSEG